LTWIAVNSGKDARYSDQFSGAFAGIGKAACHSAGFLYRLFAFIGNASAHFVNAFRRLRFPAIVRHIHETGIRALPIIALMAFGISMVVSYQAAMQLRKFGADIFTIDLTVISLLREMGVLATAIMVIGRSGSAFAAEIGVMKLRGEVDAMRTMGINPMEALVVPRLIALLLTLPLLTFMADIVGLAGGGLMAVSQLDISLTQYIDRINEVATPTMFWVGMIKAPVFAFLISVICCYQGMSVSGSAESVGRLTTLAVVQSIFTIIMTDAIFSVIFSKLEI
jgi:phospholipid/cholesterol/gamma-HCH transport system permease protein